MYSLVDPQKKPTYIRVHIGNMCRIYVFVGTRTFDKIAFFDDSTKKKTWLPIYFVLDYSWFSQRIVFFFCLT